MASQSQTQTASHTSVATDLFDSKLWIKNPLFDLLFVSGGAFFTLLVAAASFQFPEFLPIFFWIWIIGFEGSHFWATFSRTYVDPEYRSKNKTLLFGSLIFFLLPGIAIGLNQSQSHIDFALLYGFFIFVWSLYHNARQHFGFLSIYSKKAELPDELKLKMTRSLYLAVGAAQVYFLLNFKIQSAFGLAGASEINPSLGFLIESLPLYFSIGVFAYLIVLTWGAVKYVGKQSLVSLYYIFVCWFFYSTMFYFIAPQDHFVQNLSGGETLMLIAIMNSLFHNIQYHAIVWYYGNRRYKTDQKKKFGLAGFIGSNTFTYLAFALILGLVFSFITWNVGDWPSPSGSWAGVTMSEWAYIAFFGIIGHHFYLDQKIWRPSRSNELRNYLKIKGNQ